MSDTGLRPEIVRAPLGTQDFGLVEKPLTVFERLYNQVWLRKMFLIVLLLVVWELYARHLDNELLVPTFTATIAFSASRNREEFSAESDNVGSDGSVGSVDLVLNTELILSSNHFINRLVAVWLTSCSSVALKLLLHSEAFICFSFGGCCGCDLLSVTSASSKRSSAEVSRTLGPWNFM